MLLLIASVLMCCYVCIDNGAMNYYVVMLCYVILCVIP